MTTEDAINILRHIAGSYGDVSKYYDAICLAIAALERDRWISVVERLPEIGETIGGHTFSVDVYGFDCWNYRRAYYNYTAKVWLNGNEEKEWHEITHWMPLTEPPKEET